MLKSTQFSLLFSDQGQENLAIISTCVTLLCCVRGREWIGWLVGCWRRVEEEWGVCCVRGRLGFWREKGREISGEGRWERGGGVQDERGCGGRGGEVQDERGCGGRGGEMQDERG